MRSKLDYNDFMSYFTFWREFLNYLSETIIQKFIRVEIFQQNLANNKTFIFRFFRVDEVSFQIREMKQTLDKQAKDQQQSLNELSEAVANLTELIKTSKAVSV